MFVMCVLCSKDKRHSQNNQDKEVQVKYGEKKIPAGGMDVCLSVVLYVVM